MKPTTETKKNQYSSLYWSERYKHTKERLDDFGRRYKRSRVGSIECLLNHFDESEKRRTSPTIV